MLLITKEVAHKLHNEYGVKWKDNGISASTTAHKKYYLCESEYNLRCLLKVAPSEKVEQLLKSVREQKKFANQY